MKNLFIDTNVWLSLYHFSKDDLTQFEKLSDLLGKSVRLVIPQQICDEIRRNREAKLKDALKDFDFKLPNYPTFCKGYDEFLNIKSEISSVKEHFSDWMKKINEDIKHENLPADKTINMFLSSCEIIPCEKYVDSAYTRYRIGNPPGKDNKYGDAISWECLLDNINDGEDIYIVSFDKDYRSIISDDDFNPFLKYEWETKKKSKVYFYTRLNDFIKEHLKEIVLTEEREKEEYIDKLINSPHFVNTHGYIAMLKKHSGWNDNQLENICKALIENNQVLWIIGDSDVFEFYSSILLNEELDAEEGSYLYKAIQKIKKVKQEKEERFLEELLSEL